MKIKDLPKVDRPREKLEKYGAGKLSNSELLAILLRTGSEGVNVVELSNTILKKFGNGALAKASVEELKNVHGLGAAKACEIVACFELGRRMLKDKPAALLMSPEQVASELKDIRSHKKEHFVIFYLDSRNNEVKREIISVGTLNASIVHPREVFEPAIQHSAAHVIVAHNHPSGDPEPSQEDRALTERLVEAGKILGIELLDHVIVTLDRHISFKEKGMI